MGRREQKDFVLDKIPDRDAHFKRWRMKYIRRKNDMATNEAVPVEMLFQNCTTSNL